MEKTFGVLIRRNPARHMLHCQGNDAESISESGSVPITVANQGHVGGGWGLGTP